MMDSSDRAYRPPSAACCSKPHIPYGTEMWSDRSTVVAIGLSSRAVFYWPVRPVGRCLLPAERRNPDGRREKDPGLKVIELCHE